MFNIKILSQEALNNYGSIKGKEQLDKILAVSNNHMESISKTLDSIREPRVRTIRNNIIDAIESASNEVNIPEHISLTKSYKDNPIYCNFDMYHMTQVIVNLITNAIDAINSQSKEEAYIKITVDTSNEWIYISIKDSGIGISKKLQKKIFTPYFSTKPKNNNWGMGLSYAFRVITSHYGHLRIKSKVGEFTNVEILLPMTK
ncbi:MAG TPA: ATP-binding protein [Clostridiales bacterium]|nr:ATP-binding protein [Clostridiales bacterium]